MNYKQSFLCLIIVQILYFAPVIFNSQVIFAHGNDYEVSGIDRTVADNYLFNRKFSDQSSVYIPEINQHLNGNHHSWLSIWNPYVQLGRPTFQLSGFGKAYLITNILSIFTKNPFVLYTVLTVVTVSLTGIFLFLFLKALDLHPIACSTAAIGLSLGIFISYWLTFVLFIAPICWFVCLFWLNTEFIKKPSLATATGISFATYSLLMTSYPQVIILYGYLIIPYTLIRIVKSGTSVKNQIYTALMILGMALSGILMASPAYADLLINSQRSARLSGVSDDFFLAVLPKIHNLRDLGTFLSSIFDPFWLGNPIQENYSVVFNGLSLNPLYFTLFILSFADKQWRKLWPWQLFCILCLIGTIYPPVYLFAVHHLGFHLSRCQLLGGAIIPSFILAGYAIDYSIKNKAPKPIYLLAWTLIPLSSLSILNFLIWLKVPNSLKINYVIASWLVIVSLSILIVFRKYVLLQGLTLVSVLIYGQSMMLARPIDTIQTSSPLISIIREQTSDGSRFALVGDEMARIIPPNQESLFQVKSINSYDSLSSKNYQEVVQQWSKQGTKTYGRYFDRLDSDFNISSDNFRLSGVSVVISKRELDNKLTIKVGEINDIKIYKTLSAPIMRSQFVNYDLINDKDAALKLCCSESLQVNLDNLVKFDDFFNIKLNPSDRETLLFISQQYHPQWQATSNNHALKTVIINGFYQGIIIPPDTNEVELEFYPYVIWSWLPQVIYVSLGVSLLIIQFIQIQRNRISSIKRIVK
ncbi:MAG TPA: hypothetical protein DEG17_11885 [Cyanobacteria bacterium UBA11149]|nr:hypothetical protein [Cyanobacteria bacterium UBA11367]HBE59802.1 hypothetical protein [Cyanobacteria bacterium UBA11366]HBK64289.1 hypothetical protein [Cyanobacteria bacterium UBA11166]HBR72377.1 hypothetical protein [Cyanobacteria bacterium UBA11159]HBS70838.1 hypothetical protein [Cyanobacteria bacterium UBA11153]HBW89546.1 hypothetical protein [Cyanobacteria bacterium UBA11149]HCA94294.1 hypothetical protein [Cyanobacteria bacterium UBA9226]